MKLSRIVSSRLSFVGRYHFRWALVIAVSWTTVDLIWTRYFHFSLGVKSEDPFRYVTPLAIMLRGIIVFIMSSLMGVLLFKLRQSFRDTSLLYNLLLKTCILLIASLFMNFLLHVTYSVFILNTFFPHALKIFFTEAASSMWLVHHSLGWIALFLITQLVIEFYEKYSPGVFWDILLGKYIHPKVQKRIVMFIDLTDSTPIAEQLNSQKYFRFIRDFIYFVSIALLEYDGRIYQYVGDEVVVSWIYNTSNVNKCLKAVALSSRLLQGNSKYFRSKYGVVPEFKVGIHVGEVSVGEIGFIKKDIAMSGDTMNTASRICDYCNELKVKCIASKELLNGIHVNWETESLGGVDLRGKSESIDLYAIKI